MNQLVSDALDAVNSSISSFCKFISANDAGKTGAHQCGFYIPKESYTIGFDTVGTKGQNTENLVKIKWQNDFETDSRFIYYGSGTRNEYRLTRFGRGFRLLNPDSVGSLLILSKMDKDYFNAFILETEEDIEDFLAVQNISPAETNRLLTIKPESKLKNCFANLITSFNLDFPPTNLVAEGARNCFNLANNITTAKIKSNPDNCLINWVEAEYELFKMIEIDRYKSIISQPFANVEKLVEFANTILNRRKSRAGKSLEHHLAEIFNNSSLKYVAQAVTEDNKKPDFLFPDTKSYKDQNFDKNKLAFLASKTTCKDRWRQIINEADRIEEKHLFTLQQGISKNQLDEMYKYGVRLVVPKVYKLSYPEEYRGRIYSLENFIEKIRIMQN